MAIEMTFQKFVLTSQLRSVKTIIRTLLIFVSFYIQVLPSLADCLKKLITLPLHREIHLQAYPLQRRYLCQISQICFCKDYTVFCKQWILRYLTITTQKLCNLSIFLTKLWVKQKAFQKYACCPLVRLSVATARCHCQGVLKWTHMNRSPVLATSG